MSYRRLLTGALRAAGAVDLALGLGLSIAPRGLPSAVGIRTAAEPTWLRVLGAQSAAMGVTAIIVSTDPSRHRALLATCGAARLGSATALLRAGRDIAGGAVLLRLLGIAELALGATHIVHSRLPGRSALVAGTGP